jgi:hypothetical protein
MPIRSQRNTMRTRWETDVVSFRAIAIATRRTIAGVSRMASATPSPGALMNTPKKTTSATAATSNAAAMRNCFAVRLCMVSACLACASLAINRFLLTVASDSSRRQHQQRFACNGTSAPHSTQKYRSLLCEGFAIVELAPLSKLDLPPEQHTEQDGCDNCADTAKCEGNLQFAGGQAHQARDEERHAGCDDNDDA